MGALQFDLPLNTTGLRSSIYDSLPDYVFNECATAYLNKFLETYRNRKRSTRVTIDLTIRHFVGFQKWIGETFMTSQIDKEVLDQYVQYLVYEKDLKANTVQNFLGTIKRILTRIQQSYIKVDISFKESKVKLIHPYKVALTEQELAAIFCFEDLTVPLQEVRDLFILSCFTGLRYSDASRLSAHNIKDNLISIMTKKTKASVLIPIFTYTRLILEKYNYNLPHARCIQYFNKALKVVCKKVGLTRKIEYEEVKGDDIRVVSRPLYQEISSHTARRTFITTMLRNNVDALVIREITGHKSLASFALYDKTTQKEKIAKVPMRGLYS